MPLTAIGAWKGAKALAKKIPYQVWIVVGGLALLGVSHWRAYQEGKQHVQQKWDAAVKKAEAEGKDLSRTITWEMAEAEIVYVDRVKVVKEKGDVIVKEVPVYFSDLPDLPGVYRVQHDAAASGTPASPEQYASGASVPAETFAATVTENYTGCRATAEQVASLQFAYQQVRESYLALCKQPGVRCSTDK